MPELAREIAAALQDSQDKYSWLVGKYVIMPDHLHFFCSPMETDCILSKFVRNLKSWTAKKAKEVGIKEKIWQAEFFDHLLRQSESYSTKLEYVALNPVRAGLCSSPEEWNFQGECVQLEMRDP